MIKTSESLQDGKSFIEYISGKGLYYLIKYGPFEKEINMDNDTKYFLKLNEVGTFHILIGNFATRTLSDIYNAIKHDTELVVLLENEIKRVLDITVPT